MSNAIKLVRYGRNNKPFYRIVVAEKRSKLTGKVIARLGYYDPEIKKISVNTDDLKKWLAVGSQPTASVRKLLKL